ncbi:MAG: F0F1 ATP synthase subunit gamma [Candidatus Saccharimonadales bacterium]
MRHPNAILKDSEETSTVEDLTSVFESLSMNQIAKIKNNVEMSKQFFDLLWAKYSALRVDPQSRLTQRGTRAGSKDVFVVISAEAGLSGDIDLHLIETVLKDYDPKTTDIIVLGSHGAQQLRQRGINFVRYYRVPESENYVDVSPVIDAITPYRNAKIYYEEYISIGVQGIKSIDLIQTIKSMSENAADKASLISEKDTIFEPSLDEIAEIMETAMMGLAFAQVILESSLAQDASRFNAMAVAKKRAIELVALYTMEYHRSKRSQSDRQMREIITSLKRKKKERRHYV